MTENADRLGLRVIVARRSTAIAALRRKATVVRRGPKVIGVLLGATMVVVMTAAMHPAPRALRAKLNQP